MGNDQSKGKTLSGKSAKDVKKEKKENPQPQASSDDVRTRVLAAAEARKAASDGTYHKDTTRNNNGSFGRQESAGNTTTNNTSFSGQGRTASSGGTTAGMAGRQVSGGGGADGTNPVLAAAEARQRANQSGDYSSNATPEEKEKAQLLNEIRSELRKQNKDEPFGLPSSDCTKLRTYLRHLKSGK